MRTKEQIIKDIEHYNNMAEDFTKRALNYTKELKEKGE